MFKRFVAILAAIACLASVARAEKTLTLDEKTLVLRGEVDGEVVAKLQAAILSSPDKDITLVISSPGGSVIAGADLAQTIRDSGKNVRCVATFAASMAFAILQACQERYVLDNSIIMQHVMSYGMSGQEPNNWSLANLLHRLNKKMDEDQAERIGISYKEFREKVRDDWWLLGEEAVEENVADDTVAATCTAELSNKRTREKIETFFWTFEVEWSGCPLIQSPLSIKAMEEEPLTDDPEGKRKEYMEFMEKIDVSSYLRQKYILRSEEASK